MFGHRLFLALTLVALVGPVQALGATGASAQGTCVFTLGFKALRDQIPDTVGNCRENEHFNPANGNAEQATTGGLLVWRKADNWTAFTDGNITWLNGPCGLENRPNAGPTLPWEGRPGSACLVAPPPPPPTAVGRTPGTVRTLFGMTDQLQCYRLGQADKAQDQAAGVPLRVEPVLGAPPGLAVTSQVRGDPATSSACMNAYNDGYTGKPFQQR